MIDVELKKRGVYLGKTGETGRYRVWLDVSAWDEEYEGGVGLLLYTDPKGNTAPMRTVKEFDGEKTKLYGYVTAEETKEAGTGVIEARWENAGVVAKSDHFNTVVMASSYTGKDIGDNTPDWVSELMTELNAVNVVLDEAAQVAEDVAAIRETIEGAETVAKAAALDSEAWAVGERDGEDVDEDDPTYGNNARKYAQDAGGSAAAAGVYKLEAEAWAKGTKNGQAVPASDPAYQKNAKYYAEQAFSGTPEGYADLVGDVGDLKSALEAFEAGENESQIPVGEILANYVNYSSGKINGNTSTTYGHVGPFPVIGYIKIRYSRIKNTGSSDVYGLAFYNGSGFVSGKNCLKNQSEAGYELTEIDVPPTATSVAFSVFLDDTTYIPELIGVRDNKVLEHLTEIDAAIDGVQSQIDEVTEQTQSQIINIFNPANVTVNKKTYFGTGNKITTLRDQAYSALSEIMPCKEGDVITIRPGIADTSTGTASSYGVVIADADGTIIAGLNQPDRNTTTPYSIIVPEGGVMFRFNVNTNYESDLTIKYCTINRGSLDYAVPYGNVEVHRASENMVGGIIAPDKTSGDTQQVTIDPTTGAAYVNLHPASEEKRRLFVPGKVYVPSGTKPRAYWRCLSWVRDQSSVYYRYPQASTSLTQRCMPDYLQMTDGTISGKRTSSQPSLSMFDAARETKIAESSFNACFINPLALDNPQTAKNLLIIGDSFTYNIAKRIKARLTEYGLTGINMIGSKTAEDGTVYAGYGGHGYKEFIADPSTLTSPMTNPFWHDGAVDIQWFVQSQCSASTVDYVIIHLGVNDMLDGRTNTQIIEDMQTFVGYIRTAYPNVKIVIDGLVIPAMACPSNYNPVDRALKIHLYNADLETAVDEMTGTYYAPVVFFFPVEYAYPYTMSAPCEGSTETVKTLTDYLHPYTPGYYQIADEALWCLLYNADEL